MQGMNQLSPNSVIAGAGDYENGQSNNSSPTSSYISVDMRRPLANLFDSAPQQCYRCGTAVYHAEKMGPVNDVIFHKNCFRCLICGINLTLQTYCANQEDNMDKQVYCNIHKPKCTATAIDIDAIGVQSAVQAQNFYNKLSDKDTIVHRGGQLDGTAVSIAHGTNVTKMHNTHYGQKPTPEISQAVVRPRLDMNAVGIKGPVSAQRLMAQKKQTFSKHMFTSGIYKEKQKEILHAQVKLEMKHREEEDHLLEQIRQEREREVTKIDSKIMEEWEKRLHQMTQQFNAQMDRKKISSEEKKKMTVKFESQRAELSKSMEEAKEKERISVTAQMLNKERDMTSEMVTRQSKEMLNLIANKQQEIANEIGAEINDDSNLGSEDLATEKLQHKDENNSKLHSQSPWQSQSQGDYFSNNDNAATSEEKETNNGADKPYPPLEVEPEIIGENSVFQEIEDPLTVSGPQVAVVPPRIVDTDTPPSPPSCPKKSLYTDPNVFQELDQHVIDIAEGDQNTFTDLVCELTRTCETELEKVRAIFRWITVKDLSTMILEEQASNPDTPMGILRGIKLGTETYHVLFMRLCAYAGIRCEEVKGYSKSVGFEPGMKFGASSKFTNTWNAVCVDGDWRFVQCNWAARHLVFNRNMTHNPRERADKLRYQYDEHYFLTDPEHFILEFMPFDPKWQLTKREVSMEEFEELPFVRSAFFHFGMSFSPSTKAVLNTNDLGGAKLEIRLERPDEVVCHYQLRFAEDDRKTAVYYQGSKLDRYVLFTVNEDKLLFDIHVPTTGSFFLEVFAAQVDPEDRAPTQQIKLKCVTKFKVQCSRIEKRMSPLPTSASTSGEWGPVKATRHYGIKPLSHGSPVIAVEDNVTLQFWVPDNLLLTTFSVMLHKNNVNNHLLSRFCRMSLEENLLTIQVSPPETGQYALDLFILRGVTEDAAGSGPSHVCKYLLNCSRVSQTRPIHASLYVDEEKVKSGQTSACKKLNIHLQTEIKSKCVTNMTSLPIEFAVKDVLEYGYKFTKRYDPNLNEDHTDNVDIKIADNSVKFTVHFVTDGRYHFHVFAKKPSSIQFEHVYTFKMNKITNVLQ